MEGKYYPFDFSKIENMSDDELTNNIEYYEGEDWYVGMADKFNDEEWNKYYEVSNILIALRREKYKRDKEAGLIKYCLFVKLISNELNEYGSSSEYNFVVTDINDMNIKVFPLNMFNGPTQSEVDDAHKTAIRFDTVEEATSKAKELTEYYRYNIFSKINHYINYEGKEYRLGAIDDFWVSDVE